MLRLFVHNLTAQIGWSMVPAVQFKLDFSPVTPCHVWSVLLLSLTINVDYDFKSRFDWT